MADCVVKIFVEGGLESSIYGLGTEVWFYLFIFSCTCFSPVEFKLIIKAL